MALMIMWILLFSMEIITFMYLIFITVFIVIIIYELIAYIFESISIMCMSKKLQYKLIFTSWFPFYNKYILGKIVGNKVLGIMLCLLNIIILFISIFCYVQSNINSLFFCIFLVCLLLSFILDIVISHKIYKNATTKYGDILTILTILTFGLLRPLFLFIIRNKIKKTNTDEIMEIL